MTLKVETGGRSRSRSLKMAPFDRSYTTFNYCFVTFLLQLFYSFLTASIIQLFINEYDDDDDDGRPLWV